MLQIIRPLLLFYFVFFKPLRAENGNKRQILIDLVNMDVAGARKNTLEK